MGKLKVLIADDHSVLRESLKSALEFDENIEIVGEAEDGIDAIEKTEALKPDIVLMDINMPFLDGINASQEIKERSPDTKILILTMHENKQYIFSALSAGIEGYLLKMSNLKKVITAINALANGDTYFDATVTEILASKQLDIEDSKNLDVCDYFGITEREKEIINLIIGGYTTQEISEKLRISIHTASNHRTRILKKLNLKNTAELIIFSIKEGLFSV
ncbi:MAG: response regulator [Rhodothermaceae bacterium]